MDSVRSVRCPVLKNVLATLMIAAIPWIGCTERETGLLPVGSSAASVIEQTRYVKRLHLDLTGLLPSDADIDAAITRLAAEGDTPATRAEMADDLLATPAFAALFASELENRVFGGGSANDTYALFCPVLQDSDPACAGCAYAADCGGCDCPTMVALAEERLSLIKSADDIAAGDATLTDIERRYASSQIFTFNAGSAESIAQGLFENFLGRPAEPDEQKNARAMVFGALVEGSVSGLLFHQHGADYADLVKIIFTSEVYRDAAVDAVFLRYLGRGASPEELAFFSGSLADEKLDVRPVMRAVLSSREYFTQ